MVRFRVEGERQGDTDARGLAPVVKVIHETFGVRRIGGWWAVGVVCEIIIFLLMPKILKFLDLKQVILVSLILAVLRFFLIGLYADTLWILVFAQTLHAATFGSFHVASVQIIEYFFKLSA